MHEFASLWIGIIQARPFLFHVNTLSGLRKVDSGCNDVKRAGIAVDSLLINLEDAIRQLGAGSSRSRSVVEVRSCRSESEPGSSQWPHFCCLAIALGGGVEAYRNRS